jgi:hypothetical protein
MTRAARRCSAKKAPFCIKVPKKKATLQRKSMEDLHRWDLDVSTAIYKWFDIERNSSTRIITKVLGQWLLCF